MMIVWGLNTRSVGFVYINDSRKRELEQKGRRCGNQGSDSRARSLNINPFFTETNIVGIIYIFTDTVEHPPRDRW